MVSNYWDMLALMSSMFTLDEIIVQISAYDIIELSWGGEEIFAISFGLGLGDYVINFINRFIIVHDYIIIRNDFFI